MFKQFLIALVCCAGSAFAQNFTLVVPTGPGSFHDIAARHVAPAISSAINMPVVVENRIGAHGLLAAQHFLTLPPDGRSAFLGSTVVPFVAKAHPQQAGDILKTLVPVHGVSKVDILLVVSATSGIRSIADLVAKNKNGKILRAGTAAPQSNFLINQFASSTGVATEFIRYKQTAQMFIDLANNEIDFVASAASGAGLAQMIAANKLRVLAVLGSKRSSAHPTVLTLRELGFPPVDDYAWSAVFMHAVVPKTIRDTVAAAVKNALTVSSESLIPYVASAVDVSAQVQREYAQITID